MKKIINCETNEIVERELNNEELAQQLIDEEVVKNAKIDENEKHVARQEILNRLGVTIEEMKLLVS